MIHGGASNITHPCLERISPHHTAGLIRDFFPDLLPAYEVNQTFGCRKHAGKCNMEAYIVAATVCALHDVDYHGSRMVRSKELTQHIRTFVKNQRWVFNDYVRFWATRVDEEMVERNEAVLWQAYKNGWVDRGDEPEWGDFQIPEVSDRNGESS